MLLMPAVFGQSKPTGEVDVTKCWSYPAAKQGGSEFVSDSAGLFVGGNDGGVEALSHDGKKLWASELGGECPPIKSDLCVPHVPGRGASGRDQRTRWVQVRIARRDAVGDILGTPRM